jgi:molybdopterin-guanine dinucleotide biosynthesis protein A
VTTGGIVLAGGRSTRMGVDKATLDWHGVPLVVHVVRVLEGALDGPVVVVAAEGQPLPEGLDVVRDAEPGRGPSQGLLAGLEALAGRAEAAYVAAVDLPFLTGEPVTRAVGALRCGAQAAVPVVAGVRQPLAAAYSLEVAAAVEARLRRDERSLMGLLGELRVVEVPCDDLAAQLHDVDAPGDLRS